MTGLIIIVTLGVVIVVACVLAITIPSSYRRQKFKCTTCGEWKENNQIGYAALDSERRFEILCHPCAEKAGKTLPKEFWDGLKNLRLEEDRLDHRDNTRGTNEQG